VKLIPIAGKNGKGIFAKIDDEDYELVSQYTWYLHKTGYPISSHFGHQVKMHRIVMGVKVGEPWVDHRDNDPLNNQKSNLRICTPKQNSHNSPIRMYPNANQHTYKGVYFSKDAERRGKPSRWHVVIVHEGKHISFGYHKTAKAAAKVYDREIVKLRGEWAWTNFPQEKSLT
jgi:hypothetical protein